MFIRANPKISLGVKFLIPTLFSQGFFFYLCHYFSLSSLIQSFPLPLTPSPPLFLSQSFPPFLAARLFNDSALSVILKDVQAKKIRFLFYFCRKSLKICSTAFSLLFLSSAPDMMSAN